MYPLAICDKPATLLLDSGVEDVSKVLILDQRDRPNS